MSLPTCFACTYPLHLSMLYLNEFVSSCSRRGYLKQLCWASIKNRRERNIMKKSSKLFSAILAVLLMVSALGTVPANAA